MYTDPTDTWSKRLILNYSCIKLIRYIIMIKRFRCHWCIMHGSNRISVQNLFAIAKFLIIVAIFSHISRHGWLRYSFRHKIHAIPFVQLKTLAWRSDLTFGYATFEKNFTLAGWFQDSRSWLYSSLIVYISNKNIEQKQKLIKQKQRLFMEWCLGISLTCMLATGS